MNLYAYVEGNPLVNVDPSGLLLTAVHGLQRGMSTQNAMQASQVGNAGAGALLTTAAAAASVTAASRLPAAGRAAVEACKKVPDPCKNAILALALGAGICNNDPKNTADDFVNDLKRREQLRHGSETAGQKKIGNQKQYP